MAILEREMKMRPEIPHPDEIPRGLPAMRTTNADVARRCLGRIFARHRLEVRGGKLDFIHRQTSLGCTSVSLLEYGSEVEITAPPLDFFMLQMTLSGCVRLSAAHFSVKLDAGSIFVMNPRTAYRKHWDRDARQLMLKIPRSFLSDHLSARSGAGHLQSIEFCPVAQRSSVLTAPLRHFLAHLERDGGVGVDVSGPNAARERESAMLDALLASLPHTSRADAAVARAVPYYVRRAERHLLANPGVGVTTAALADVAGVSERTLQQGFQRFRGRPPSQVSRELRLDLARTALALEGSGNVTGVALQFGFSHLGRFAQSYAMRFGEHPSDTVRRRRPH